MRRLVVGLLAGLAGVACVGLENPPVSRPGDPTITAPSRTGSSALPEHGEATASDGAGPPSTLSGHPSPAAGRTIPAVPLAKMTVERAFPGISFRRMVYLTHPSDGTNRLFLVLQPGRIMVFPNEPEASSAGTFLDIRDRVNDEGNEEGLLGLAFDPGFRSNGYFYVHYSASRPRRSVISRFSALKEDPNIADPDSEEIVLQVPQPFSNHNGGQLAFGPDGYLYLGLGDGGKFGDPRKNGQNRATLLGSILRIDTSSFDRNGKYSIPPDNPFAKEGDEARPEIWAYGLRNPWRFSFDRLTGDLWAGDVGQDRYEEVDIIRPGLNYGWNIMEGFHCYGLGFEATDTCDANGVEPPVIAYGRLDGCSIIGGYVYRGARLASLYGAYIYGDFCSGKIWGLRHDGIQIVEHLELVDSGLDISSFGEDQASEVYILSLDRKIYRLSPRG